MAGQGRTEDSAPYLSARPVGEADAWTAEAPTHTQALVDVSTEVPPVDIAGKLRIGEGETAVVRRRIMYVDGTAVEKTDSWYPAPIAAGTALAERRKIKGGAVTLLAELGHAIAETVEDVTAASLEPGAAAELELPAGTPVLILVRTSLNADGQPVEVGVMQMLAGQHLNYRSKAA